jgi:hypothetical protein
LEPRRDRQAAADLIIFSEDHTAVLAGRNGGSSAPCHASLIGEIEAMLAEISLTSIILWGICLLLAVGVGWSRYEKKKTRDKFLRELIAMDPVRREKVLSRLRPEMQMDLRRELMERYRISSIQSGRS